MEVIAICVSEIGTEMKLIPNYWNISDDCLRLFFSVKRPKVRRLINEKVKDVRVCLRNGFNSSLFKVNGYEFKNIENLCIDGLSHVCLHMEREKFKEERAAGGLEDARESKPQTRETSHEK